jgi:hypothetical protein
VTKIELELLQMSKQEFIEWPGRGLARHIPLRGMSDYSRMDTWATPCGARLIFRNGLWKAQFKGATSKWFHTPEEAMKSVDESVTS